MKVTIERDLCIGCGNCESIAPAMFELGKDGLARVVNPIGAEDSLIKEAAESCPVDAIILEDETGKRIYP